MWNSLCNTICNIVTNHQQNCYLPELEIDAHIKTVKVTALVTLFYSPGQIMEFFMLITSSTPEMEQHFNEHLA